MSEPKRYAIRGFSAALVEEENGVFIRYEDYARLKAEVEEARKISGEGMSVTLDLNNQLCAENARLKAEVERLNNESDILQKCCEHQKNRIERLKAEVERLTKQAKGMSKAGWSLVNAHQYDASISYWNKCINDWQNADKGVQS